jgi:hypothetical protein
MWNGLSTKDRAGLKSKKFHLKKINILMRCLTLNHTKMANDFKPTIGGSVPKSDADLWIEDYDKEHRKDKGKDTKSVFYGKDVLLSILNQEGCTGISFFLASKHSDFAQKKTVQLVLVGRKEDGTLLWGTEGKDGGDPGSVDTGLTCPPTC